MDVDGVAGIDYPIEDAYLDYTDPANFMSLDQPQDVVVGILPVDSSGNEPQLGAIEQYCTAYLQRLADPTLPFDPVTNPYRTIDWITVDLTVFSGEDRESKINTGGPFTYARSSRQRNGSVRTRDDMGVLSILPANALYSFETGAVSQIGLDTTAADYFAFIGGNGFVQNSLGFLNTQTLGNINRADPTNAVDVRRGRSNPAFVGFEGSIGSEGATSANVTGNDRNLPQIPYAIHPWLNRPFATPFELMMVPACSQGRLFEEFSFNPTSGSNPPIYPDGATPANSAIFNAPFRHLLNFFHNDRDSNSNTAGQFVRLFDFVHTLPRFQGEVEVFDPDRLNDLNNAAFFFESENNTMLAEFRTLFTPPFNFVYGNRRQGRINLNSISEFPVWVGLMKGHLNNVEFTSTTGTPSTADQLSYENFLRNRRGYDPPGGPPDRVTTPGASYNYDPDVIDPRIPTQIAGVFKNSLDSEHAPVIRDTTDANLLRRRGVNANLFRGSGTLEENEVPISTSLFVRAGTQLPNPDPTVNPHLDRDRNAFMRYQTLMRMPNLVSDNSQTFLLRLTLGFFEVDSATLSLGREYGEELGLNERYKATFIVDRSKEVGFIPGQDLNARDVVIYERYDQ